MPDATQSAPARNGAEPDRATALAILRQRFGENFVTGAAVRAQHANTLTWYDSEPPDGVLFVASEEEVAEAVGICAAHRLPVIPFGAGTSLEGQVNAPKGGLSIDLSRMDRIKEVHANDLDCVVEPGVSRKRLNDYVKDQGLFFPVDPGAEEATLGGMASTRASGTNAVRYGTMRENVLSVRAVLADGRIISTGGRARKSANGYDLTRLFVGSEGTLGVITELTVRLFGLPETILAAVCPFKSMEGACQTVIHAIELGLGLARMELVDEPSIIAMNLHSKLSLEVAPTLFLEFHGTPVSARDQVERFRAIAEDEGALRFDWAEKEEDRKRLWKARHDAYWSVKTAYPGKDLLATDVCVPISRLAECVLATQQDLKEHGLIAPIIGHAGDGNFHTTPIFDRTNAAEVKAVKGFCERLTARAIAMQGTCTGEHGVGQGKMPYLVEELKGGLDVMASIKRALDPMNLMNPGKIFKLEDATA